MVVSLRWLHSPNWFAVLFGWHYGTVHKVMWTQIFQFEFLGSLLVDFHWKFSLFHMIHPQGRLLQLSDIVILNGIYDFKKHILIALEGLSVICYVINCFKAFGVSKWRFICNGWCLFGTLMFECWERWLFWNVPTFSGWMFWIGWSFLSHDVTDSTDPGVPQVITNLAKSFQHITTCGIFIWAAQATLFWSSLHQTPLIC